jgi:ABC-type transport system involved in cytochrome c biogenesis permease subunit
MEVFRVEVPWSSVLTAVLVALIVVCSSILAFYRIADWRDVYTVYLIILAGLGFMTSGIYYGMAKAYREALALVTAKKASQEEKEKSVA